MNFALHATASYFGQLVDDQVFPRGRAIQLGNSRHLDLPVPAGAPFVAKVQWVSGNSATVLDGLGREYRLTADEEVVIEIGPVRVDLELVPQFNHRRVEAMNWGGSLAWLAAFLAFSVLAQQGMLVWNKRCVWGPGLIDKAVATQVVPRGMAGTIAGRYFGQCYQDPNEGNGITQDGIDVTAEYLARLLREDFDGAEKGVYTDKIERPDADKKSDKQFYLPAGNKGPITKMGGAEDKAPEPVRSPEEKEAVKKDRGKPKQLAVEDVGTPIPSQPDVTDGQADAGSAIDEKSTDDVDPTERPAEEEEGWGLTDWYDQNDRKLEQIEIDVMLRHARHRLAINPNDPEALSVLSYYQYLSRDYDAAERTYNKYISILPESSAGYNNKALVYKRRGEYETEESLYRVALALEPTDVTAMNNLAVCLSHQKRFDEALEVMRQLEVLDPDDPYADLHRAKIYADMGREDEAYTYLEKALKGMQELDTLHHIEFRQDIRVDPSFEKLRKTERFRAVLLRYYGRDTPLPDRN